MAKIKMFELTISEANKDETELNKIIKDFEYNMNVWLMGREVISINTNTYTDKRFNSGFDNVKLIHTILYK